jgi:hypothetical protein
MPDYHIVLASHKEELNWLKYLPKDRKYKVVVSNSSGPDYTCPLADVVIRRDNYGREAGHYLNYILENYEALPEVMVFMQADPWPHAAMYSNSCVILEVLFGKPSFLDPLCYLGQEYRPSPYPFPESSEHHKVLKRAHLGTPIGRNLPISIGAQFYVRREVVLARTKDYYARLLEIARDQILYHADPLYTLAHTLEGCWGCVFQHEDQSRSAI